VPDKNPLSALKTLGELWGFCWKRLGEEKFRDVVLAKDDTPREQIEEAAEELRRAGLYKAAEIVAEHGRLALPEDDLSRCPYMQSAYKDNPHNHRNVEAWLASKRRRLADRRPDR
jgi:hypothetical protein